MSDGLRDQKIRISISIDALAKLWLLGERRNMTGPMIASRVIEEIAAQNGFEMFINAAKNRARRSRVLHHEKGSQ
jgi:hypothetical protein